MPRLSAVGISGLQAGEDVKVLTVVYLPGDMLRIISFRLANRREREKYHE